MRPTASGFWDDLTQYLRDFQSGLSGLEESGLPPLGEGSVWWRREGQLHLSADEYRDYRRLVHRACEVVAPDGDLSKSAIDSALQDAIFKVADLSGTRAASVERRIKQALDEFMSFVGTPAQEYECWVEVEGLRTDTLPTTFGVTRLVLLGDRHIEHLAGLVRTKHTADKGGKLSTLDKWMGEDIRGRPVAILRVAARDEKAAVTLAMRELSITLECLNFFAGVIPYNRHRRRLDGARMPTCLRIGEAKTAIALRMAVAENGSFWHRPEATKLGTFSLDRLRELPTPVADAVKRVEALLVQVDRNPVEELLLRAARWVGRAADAGSVEDQFLFAMIALECVVLPTGSRHARQQLSSRIASMLVEDGDDLSPLQEEIRRLYGIRSELVHDGSREVPETEGEWLYWVALQITMRSLLATEVEEALTLGEMDAFWRTGLRARQETSAGV